METLKSIISDGTTTVCEICDNSSLKFVKEIKGFNFTWNQYQCDNCKAYYISIPIPYSDTTTTLEKTHE